MSEQNKTKKKKTVFCIVGIVLIIAIICTAVFDPFNWFNPKNPTDPIVVDPENPPEDMKFSYNGNWTTGTEKMNAYDFIMEVMSEPQYWGEEARHPYAGAYAGVSDKEKYDPLLTEQNITGWILLDENTATFRRGVTCDFQINFSTHTSTNYQYEKWNTINEATIIDLNANTYKEYWFTKENSIEMEDEEVEYIYETDINLEEDRQRLADLDLDYSLPVIVYDTFDYYEELFAFAGCPLLNQPEGTLTSYKNKTIKVPIKVEKSDAKTHYIWEFENFSFNFWETDNDSIQWLDNYRDIFNQKVPKSDIVEIASYDENGVRSVVGYCSKTSNLFLCFANKDTVTEQYFDDSPLWDPLQHEFMHMADAAALYILQPMSEAMYGYSTVYFTDVHQVLVDEDTMTNLVHGMSVDDFKNNLKISECDYDPTITIDPYADANHIVSNYMHSTAIDERGYRSFMQNLIIQMEFLGAEYPFTYDYFQYFVVYYNMDLQRCLGLR